MHCPCLVCSLLTPYRLVCSESLVCFNCQEGEDLCFIQDCIYLRYYPPYMREVLGNHLPDFTLDEWAIIKGSSDFYDMNTYTTNLCSQYLHIHVNWTPDRFIWFYNATFLCSLKEPVEMTNTKDMQIIDYTFTRPDGTQLGNQGKHFANLLNLFW
jgi:hypothetical protein